MTTTKFHVHAAVFGYQQGDVFETDEVTDELAAYEKGGLIEKVTAAQAKKIEQERAAVSRSDTDATASVSSTMLGHTKQD